MTHCRIPLSATFDYGTIERSGYGDNSSQTWASDDQVYANMSDGEGWAEEPYYRSRLWRIAGGPQGFTPSDVPGYLDLRGRPHHVSPWFAYGIISVDGTIYQYISHTGEHDRWGAPFHGILMVQSPDHGKSWYLHDGREVTGQHVSSETPELMFNWQVAPGRRDGAGDMEGHAFAWVEVVQMGQDNQLAKDDFIYVYSPYAPQSEQLNLARVPKGRITDWSAYEFFQAHRTDGTATWTQSVDARGVVHEFPTRTGSAHFGWFSWLPSIVWNEALGLYIMVNGGTYPGSGLSAGEYWEHWSHSKSGSIGLYWAANPWGPWHEFFYDSCFTTVDDDDRTYQPKLSPKWMSADGTQMWMIWSDRGGAVDAEKQTSTNRFYKWNQMRFDIQMQHRESPEEPAPASS
ncbi:MAG: DUF4185 domain-containing protein [Gemmatimonadetes bacterium]|jgi:hypothetical protein|nr:DUF4185 domain-containing protein [Gemmatimonadota bacterium]